MLFQPFCSYGLTYSLTCELFFLQIIFLRNSYKCSKLRDTFFNTFLQAKHTLRRCHKKYYFPLSVIRSECIRFEFLIFQYFYSHILLFSLYCFKKRTPEDISNEKSIQAKFCKFFVSGQSHCGKYVLYNHCYCNTEQDNRIYPLYSK